MQRILLFLVGAVGLWFAGRAVVYALVSDETRIRWIVEEMEESFDDARVRGCLRPIAQDWSHEDHAWLDRETLHGGLVRAFFQERGKDKQFLLDVDVPEENLVIEVDGDRADVRAVVKFHRAKDERNELAWHMELQATFEDGDDGWQIVRSSHRNVEGRGL